MILRFATNLGTVDFTNDESERTMRPVKVQMRGSGGCWRTLQGLANFTLVHSLPLHRHQMARLKLLPLRATQPAKAIAIAKITSLRAAAIAKQRGI